MGQNKFILHLIEVKRMKTHLYDRMVTTLFLCSEISLKLLFQVQYVNNF